MRLAAWDSAPLPTVLAPHSIDYTPAFGFNSSNFRLRFHVALLHRFRGGATLGLQRGYLSAWGVD